MLNAREQALKDFWIKEIGVDSCPDDNQWYKWLAHGDEAVLYALGYVARRNKLTPMETQHIHKAVSSAAKKQAIATGYVRPRRTYTHELITDADPAFTPPTEWLNG